MGTPVVHFEIAVKNGAKGREFYSKLFDWEIKVDEKMGYGSVDAGEGGIGGGIMQTEEGQFPPYVTFYVEVDDIQTYLDKAEAHGGKTTFPPTEIPGVGWIGMFLDPDGSRIGLWKKP